MTAVAPVAAIAALAVGGVAYASSGGSAAPHAKATATAEPGQSGPDTDNIQSGDQTTPDAGSNAAEQSSETSGESGSANDGPGGHTDAPGNVDHQFQGQE
ncbi:MAG TPA: hypothetical protein VGD37_08705 [Kofleriaceae bacterium]|jgi:hypothetical protein